MTSPGTWTADAPSAPRRRRPDHRRLLTAVALLAGVALAWLLFVGTAGNGPDRSIREPGTFGQIAHADLLPGYQVDRDLHHLGPARLLLAGERAVFVPARTPFSGATPCRALRLPESDEDRNCTLYVWFAEDGRTASWLTLLRPGGPGESLLDGRLLASSASRLVLADGTSVQPAATVRLSECGDDALDDLAGRDVVVSIDDTSGLARQITCRV